MQLISCLSIVVACLTLLVALTNAAPSSSHGNENVPTHLKKSGVFYRGLYQKDIKSLEKTYIKGHHPTIFGREAGEFAPKETSAFYVFDSKEEAEDWGRCYTAPSAVKTYVVATYQYTPKSNLKTKYFSSPNEEWRKFTTDNYKPHTKKHAYDMVEGPIGVNGKPAVSKITGKVIWQGAFVSQAALETLVLTDLKEHKLPAKHGSLKCVIL